MATKLTQQQVVFRLHKINPFVKITSQYTGKDHKLGCKCLKCGYNWQPRWNDLRKGHGCPSCAGGKLSYEATLAKLRNKVTGLTITSVFGNRAKCTCNRCAYKWNPRRNDLMHGSGCPRCAGFPGQNKNTKWIRQQVKSICSEVKVISTYTGWNKPLTCKCRHCGHTWVSSWNSLSQGHGCFECTKLTKSESYVRSVLERLTGWKFPTSKPSETPWLGGRLRLDGYNKTHKLAFERNGEQHYKLININGRQDTVDAFLQRKRYDWRKRVQCWRHGIKLITVPCWVRDVELYLRKKLKRFGIVV